MNIVVRYPLGGCDGGARLLDSVSLSLRYAPASPPPAPLNTSAEPAALTVTVVNADNKPVATVAAGIALNATAASASTSASSAFAPPLRIAAGGLAAPCSAGIGANPRGRLFIQLQVANNDLPVDIALDDLAGGFRLSVGWVAAPTARPESM